MKKIISVLFVLLFAFSLVSFSQDIIYKRDGSKEETKIVLVGEKEIQYKKFNNLDGPVYTMNKKDIVLITYENGEYETINNPQDNKIAAKADLAENFAKNIIAYHLFDVVYGDFTFSYERILASGTVSVKIPVGIGYDYNGGYNNFNGNRVYNYIYSGIGVNFYPTGQGKWRYFVGPNIRVGYGKLYGDSYYDEYGNYINHNSEGIYTKFFVDNGVMFTPIRNFCVAAVVGVGVRYFPEAHQYYNAVMATGYFSINVCYRF